MKLISIALSFCIFLFGSSTGHVTAASPSDAGSSRSLVVTSESYRTVARKVSPAVVNIRIKKNLVTKMQPQIQGRRPTLIMPYGVDDELRKQLEQLLDEQFNQTPMGQAQQDQYVGAGSGVIIKSDGYIITSNHVVANCTPDNIEVSLSDGTKFDRAEIVGTDALTDLAVLKVQTSKKLPFADWGNSDTLEPGDIVVAIGNPLDFNNSISEGIVSAKHRIIKKAPIEDLIQTTAMINPGNSGGALCDLDGKVIGINMAIATDTGLWSGLGFAIPSRLAQSIADQLINSGRVSRGFLGIEMEALTRALARQLGYNNSFGIVVREVNKDSAAEKAGLRRYDIIAKVDGKEVNDAQEMVSRIGSKNQGDTAVLEVYRNEGNGLTTTEIKVTLGERPTDKGTEKPNAPGASPAQPNAPTGLLGLDLRPVRNGNGVEVAGITPNSPASNAGIQQGDIILEVNKMKVNDAQSVIKAFSSNTNVDSHLIYLERGGQSIFAQIPTK